MAMRNGKPQKMAYAYRNSEYTGVAIKRVAMTAKNGMVENKVVLSFFMSAR